MKTEKEILEIYMEEKEIHDKDVYYQMMDEKEIFILQGRIKALECILEIGIKK